MRASNPYTPGPWTIIADERGRSYLWREGFRIDSETGEGYVLGPFEGYSEADARLIAAAPQLLEALEWLLTFVDSTADIFPIELPEPYVSRVRAAIAKAKEAK